MQRKTTCKAVRPGLRTTAVAVMLSLACTGVWAAATTPELRLTQKQARCLADNAELLLRDDGDPVTFYFDLCSADPLAKGDTRQTLPNTPKRGAKNAEDAPIKVSKALLRCLQEKKARTPAFLETNPVVLNTSACQQ